MHPNLCGPINGSLTAAKPTLDRDNGIAHLTQRRRQIEHARLPVHLYASLSAVPDLFPIASFADGDACRACKSEPALARGSANDGFFFRKRAAILM